MIITRPLFHHLHSPLSPNPPPPPPHVSCQATGSTRLFLALSPLTPTLTLSHLPPPLCPARPLDLPACSWPSPEPFPKTPTPSCFSPRWRETSWERKVRHTVNILSIYSLSVYPINTLCQYVNASNLCVLLIYHLTPPHSLTHSPPLTVSLPCLHPPPFVHGRRALSMCSTRLRPHLETGNKDNDNDNDDDNDRPFPSIMPSHIHTHIHLLSHIRLLAHTHTRLFFSLTYISTIPCHAFPSSDLTYYGQHRLISLTPLLFSLMYVSWLACLNLTLCTLCHMNNTV